MLACACLICSSIDLPARRSAMADEAGWKVVTRRKGCKQSQTSEWKFGKFADVTSYGRKLATCAVDEQGKARQALRSSRILSLTESLVRDHMQGGCHSLLALGIGRPSACNESR